MSDNDLIRRGDALEAIYALHADGKKGIMNAPRNSYGEDLRDVLAAIGDIPAVPHEMSAREFLHGFSRMCATYPAYGNDTGCKGCPLEYDRTCDLMRSELADHYIDVVQKWLREHPEESKQ